MNLSARLCLIALTLFTVSANADLAVSEIEAHHNEQINHNNRKLSDLRQELRHTVETSRRAQIGNEIFSLTSENERLERIRDEALSDFRARERARVDEERLQAQLDQLQKSNPTRYQAMLQVMSRSDYSELSEVTRRRLIDEKERELSVQVTGSNANLLSELELKRAQQQNSYSPYIARIEAALAPIRQLVSSLRNDTVSEDSYTLKELAFLKPGSSRYTQQIRLPGASGLIAEDYFNFLLSIEIDLGRFNVSTPKNGENVGLELLVPLENLLFARGFSTRGELPIERLASIAENYFQYVSKDRPTILAVSLLHARAAWRSGFITKESIPAVAEFKRRQIAKNPEFLLQILNVLNQSNKNGGQRKSKRTSALELSSPGECESIVEGLIE